MTYWELLEPASYAESLSSREVIYILYDIPYEHPNKRILLYEKSTYRANHET